MSQTTKNQNSIYDWGSNLTYEQEREYLSKGYNVFRFCSGSESPEWTLLKMSSSSLLDKR